MSSRSWLFIFLLLLTPLAAQKTAAPAKGQPPATRQISIVNIRLAQYEDGPVITVGHGFIPGESVFLSFQISGYNKNEQEKIQLEYHVTAKDPAGVPIVEQKEGKVAAELAPEDKDWLPKVREQIIIPPAADSGTYRIDLWVKDALAGVEAVKAVELPVKGHHVEPAKEIALQNFHWLRTENDTASLPTVASYRPGDMVWARFDIVGFSHGKNNHYEVRYGLSVRDAEDKELYSVPEAASDAGESFYPKRYVPGVLSFGLPPDIKAALYTVVLFAEDTSGKHRTEGRYQFRVE